jgi:phosphoenolpyruvate-protein kinase (PTS system EI component)
MVRVESLQVDFPEASQSAQKQFAETQKKISDAMLQTNEEFLKAFEEIRHDIMCCAAAEAELCLQLTKKLSTVKSVPEAMAAYQEWLTKSMTARLQDVSRISSQYQKFISNSTQLFWNN